MDKIILIGAGGHSKSVADSISKKKYQIHGFIDGKKTGSHLGKPIFGRFIEDVPNYRMFSYFICIGDVDSRKIWFEKIKNYRLRTINIIDRTAIVSCTAKIGSGNFIGKYAIINADSIVGDNNIINTKALVEHECHVGNHVHLSTNSTINGNITVEDGVFLGSSAVCNGQLTLGHNSIIGSGSVVIKDVEPNTTVVGVPAHAIKRRASNES